MSTKASDHQQELQAAQLRIGALERELAEARAQLDRVKSGIDALRDERDRAVFDRNTALAKLGAAERSMARKPLAGSSDSHGLDNLDEAIAIASAGNRR